MASDGAVLVGVLATALFDAEDSEVAEADAWLLAGEAGDDGTELVQAPNETKHRTIAQRMR